MHTIVPAALEDARAILEIQKRAFAEEGRLSGSQDIPPLTETVEAVAEHIRHQTALVARIGARIVGSVRGIAAGTVCTIRGLSIEPSHQGRGIGASLLHAIEAAHPHATCFELTTNTVMASNVRFYERHGYHVMALTRHSDKIILAQMRKPATQPVNAMQRPALIGAAGESPVLLNALAASAQTEPPGFMVVEYEVTDPAGYREYLRASAAARSSGSAGTFLVRGAQGVSLSGEPPKTVAIIQFPSVADAIAFDTSPEYAALKLNRDQSIKWRSFVVEGVATQVSEH